MLCNIANAELFQKERIFKSFALALSSYCLLTLSERKTHLNGIKRTFFKEYTLI